MVWRGSPRGKDRFFACLIYLVPLIEVIPFGVYLFSLFPPLIWLFIPFLPLLPIYHLNIGGIAFIQWGIFFWLFLGVARNERLIHFLRYNAMQGLLLAILAALCSAFLALFGMSQTIFLEGWAASTAGSNSLLLDATTTLIFLFVAGSSLYSIFQCIRGLYANIPVVSDAAYSQVR
jgi:hypothetical protein